MHNALKCDLLLVDGSLTLDDELLFKSQNAQSAKEKLRAHNIVALK